MYYLVSRLNAPLTAGTGATTPIINSTFDICVGECQRLFTLNEDILTQRSKFLCNGREQSKRWWRRNRAKMLADQDPEIFAAYVHAVRFGVGSLEERVRSDTLVDSGFQTDEEDGHWKHIGPKKAKTARFLVDLYLLAADKLLDPVTANIVIDVLADPLVDFGLDEPLFAITPHVYASTVDGSPLRMLVRDSFVYHMCGSWAEDAQAHGLPYELLKDFVVEICHVQTNNDSGGVIGGVLIDHLVESRCEGYYHIS